MGLHSEDYFIRGNDIEASYIKDCLIVRFLKYFKIGKWGW